MQSDLVALGITCSHFKDYRSAELISLRKRINSAHVQNHRLRKKMVDLEKRIEFHDILNSLLRSFMNRILTLLENALSSIESINDTI